MKRKVLVAAVLLAAVVLGWAFAKLRNPSFGNAKPDVQPSCAPTVSETCVVPGADVSASASSSSSTPMPVPSQ